MLKYLENMAIYRQTADTVIIYTIQLDVTQLEELNLSVSLLIGTSLRTHTAM